MPAILKQHARHITNIDAETHGAPVSSGRDARTMSLIAAVTSAANQPIMRGEPSWIGGGKRPAAILAYNVLRLIPTRPNTAVKRSMRGSAVSVTCNLVVEWW